MNKILDVLYPIKDLLQLTTNDRRNIKCPNPDHKDKKPSAHVYRNSIWCFTCKRFYYISDIIKFKKLNRNKLFLELKKKYGDNLEKEAQKNDIEKEEKKEIRRGKNENFILFTKRFFNECE